MKVVEEKEKEIIKFMSVRNVHYSMSANQEPQSPNTVAPLTTSIRLETQEKKLQKKPSRFKSSCH